MVRSPPMDLAASVLRPVARSVFRLPAPLLRVIAGRARTAPDGTPLDLQTQALLRMNEAMGGSFRHETVARSRREMEKGSNLIKRHVPGVATEDRTIAGPGGAMRVRIYRHGLSREPRGVLVYFHGGGFVLGSIESHDEVCRELAAGSGVLVVSVDYRLAPEHKFPAAVEDAIAATRWVLNEAQHFGGDPLRVAVGGDSAGGCLAAVACHALRDEARKPVYQLLIYPVADMRRQTQSMKDFGDGFLLTRDAMDWFVGHYLRGPADELNPLASPLLAERFEDLPRAMVLIAGFDPLRDEGRAYVQKLRGAGVVVDERVYHNTVHGFFSMSAVLEEGRRAMDDATHGLKVAIG